MENKLRMLSLFSGIGAFEKALTNLNIPFELVAFSEIDPTAIKAYCKIHNIDSSKNLGDISKLNFNQVSDIDLLTYGFPCQDISVLGKEKGFEENGKSTRSGLVYKAFEIIESIKPKYCIMENVKNLVGKNFINDFNHFLSILNDLGYNNYYKVLKATDFGVPQNRERVFVVSIRKDVDKGFTFKEKTIQFNFQDIIECDGPQDTYLTDDKLENIRSRVFSMIDKTKIWSLPIIFDDYNNRIKVNQKEIGTLTANIGTKTPRNGSKLITAIDFNHETLEARVISPEESFLLMGFDAKAYFAAASVCTDSQIYKLARNSIVVPIIEEIYKKLFK